jgi:hypothetical protein
MAIRPLTEEEKVKAEQLIERIKKDSSELYELLAPIMSHRDFCSMIGGLRQKVYEAQRDLEKVRQIREYLDQLPGAGDLVELNSLLEKLRV